MTALEKFGFWRHRIWVVLQYSRQIQAANLKQIPVDSCHVLRIHTTVTVSEFCALCDLYSPITQHKIKYSYPWTAWIKHHASRKGEWRYTFTILNFSTRQTRTVSFTPLPFYLRGNCPQCQLHRKLGGHQSQCGRHGEERNPLPLPSP
jgi:hypothetical protein